jgi:N-carbamoylputrescine amidase
MKVTVCQLDDGALDDGASLERDWQRLAAHVTQTRSDLVLLPEMPFHPWLCGTPDGADDEERWREAVQAHDRWLERFDELAPAAVAGTRAALRDGRRLNEGFVREADAGYRSAHDKRYLPEEEGFWEATWYGRGDGAFDIAQVAGARVGWLICSELWFAEWGRGQGREGAQLILSPRATPASTVSKWIAGGRAAAVVSGAYNLSSNRCGVSAQGIRWGGAGWVSDPEGRVLGLTNDEHPFLTVELDLALADEAKMTYPRYITE